MSSTCSIVRNQCLDYIENRMNYHKNGDRYGEESITDEIIYQLSFAQDSKIYHAPNESKTGADIEWWLVDSHTQKAITLRMQAKKLYQNGKYHGINRYVGATGQRQIDRLISEAIKDKAIPLYCFYNYLGGIGTTPSSNRTKKDSWSYSHAMSVKNIIPSRSPAHYEISPTNIIQMGFIEDIVCSNNFISGNFMKELIEAFVNDQSPTNMNRFDYYSKKHHNKILNTNDFIRNMDDLLKVESIYAKGISEYPYEAKVLLVTQLDLKYEK